MTKQPHRILIVGDVHFKKDPDSPYNSGLRKLFDYLLKKYPDCVWIFTGDFFDNTSIHWDVYNMAYGFLRSHPHEIYILTGNHDLSAIKGNALYPLHDGLRIHVISDDVKYLDIAGYRVAMLPYLYGAVEMKKYENLTETVDFSVSHLSPPGKNYGAPDEIELKFKSLIAHIYGHIHIPFSFKNQYGNHEGIAVPQVTRYGEQGYDKVVAVIDGGKFSIEKLPTFFTIEDVTYGDMPVNKDNLINIVNAPSVDLAKEKYTDFHIRRDGIKLLRTDSASIKNDTDRSLKKDVPEKFLIYAAKENISKQVTDTTAKALREAENMK